MSFRMPDWKPPSSEEIAAHRKLSNEYFDWQVKKHFRARPVDRNISGGWNRSRGGASNCKMFKTNRMIKYVS